MKKVKQKPLRAIYIGDHFYSESGTAMSSIYEKDTWRRLDWGLIEIALRNGQPVNMRPANEGEMQIATRYLDTLKADRALHDTKW